MIVKRVFIGLLQNASVLCMQQLKKGTTGRQDHCIGNPSVLLLVKIGLLSSLVYLARQLTNVSLKSIES